MQDAGEQEPDAALIFSFDRWLGVVSSTSLRTTLITEYLGIGIERVALAGRLVTHRNALSDRVNFKVSGCLVPQDHTELAVVLGQVHASLSFDDLRLLADIADSWSTRVSSIIDHASRGVRAVLDLSQTQPTEQATSPTTSTAIIEQTSPRKRTRERASFHIDEVWFALVHDKARQQALSESHSSAAIGSSCQPLMLAHVSNASCTAENWSLGLHVKLTNQLAIDYFNSKIDVWEPVLEPCILEVLLSKEPESPWHVSFSSNEEFNVNISATALETILQTIDSLEAAPPPPPQVASSSTSSSVSLVGRPPTIERTTLFHPYLVCNLSGLEVHYSIDNLGTHLFGSQNVFDRVAASNEPQRLPPNGARIPLRMHAADYFPRADREQRRPWHDWRLRTQASLHGQQRLSLVLPGFHAVSNLPLTIVGRYAFLLRPDASATLSGKPQQQRIGVLEIEQSAGSKVITIRSHLRIHNLLPRALDLMLMLPDSGLVSQLSLSPNGGSLAVPINLTNATAAFCPVDMGYRFGALNMTLEELEQSLPLSSSSQQQPSSSAGCRSHTIECTRAMASSEQDDTTKEPFFLSLAAWRSGDCKADVHISLVPPLTLENLLAVPIEIKLSSPYSPITSHRLFSGDLVPVTSVRGSEQISIQMLLATGVFAWSSHLELVLDNVPANEQSASLTCTAVDPDHNALLLKWVKTVTSDGAVVLSVYCDYELINKSGLPMLFRTQPTPTSTSVCAGQHQLEVDLKADIQSQVYTGDPLAWYPLGSPFQKPQLLLLGVANIRQECKLQVRAADSNWSEPLAIQTTRASGTILLSRHKPSPDSTTASSSWSWLLGSTASPSSPASPATAAVPADSVEGLIPLSISVELCTGKFWRTKRVVFYPGCLLINRLEDVSLYYRQAPAPAPSPSASTTTTTPSDSNPDLHWSGFHLPAGSSVPLMWPRERLARLLQVRSHSTADEATPAVDSEWSIGFQVDAPRSFLLCLTSGGMSGAPRNLYVRVTVTQITSLMETELRDSSALAVVFAPAMGHFDYVLENNTRFAMRYYQENWYVLLNLPLARSRF